MMIDIGEYKLIQDGNTFNLIWISKAEETLIEEINGKRVRTKTGKLIDKEVEMGYNMTLETCVKRMIMNNLSEKDLVVNLKEWIKMYREEREKIQQLITL